MSAMDVDSDVSTVLAVMREEVDPELSAVFYEFEDLYERKLWYQLSVALEENFYQNELSKGLRFKIYDRFISKFATTINPLKLIEFVLASIPEVETLEEGLTILENLQKELILRKEKGSSKNLNSQSLTQAIIFASSEIANTKLSLVTNNDYDEVKKIIDEVQQQIDQLNSIDNRINASFYKTLSNYYKLNLDYSNFYKTSLLYLACIPNLGNLTKEQRTNIVYEISLSALVGEKIYNFGELIMHDIFSDLDSLPWLKLLLLHLNSGNLTEFTKLLEANDNKLIQEHKSFLKQKICIMSLIELVFTKPSNLKILKFDEILSSISLLTSINEVEYLIMKCLSLKLIKGHINQVAQEFEINWVQPRVMNKDQIEIMKSKLVDWNENVVKLTEYMDANGKEVWV